MKYDLKKKEILLGRKISELDRFVLEFTSLLDRYVIVSGYVSILTGRSRATEDVDLLIPKMTLAEFSSTWKKIYLAGFECLNSSILEEAYNFLNDYAIRFSRKDKPIPNMEFKIIKNDVDQYSFDNKIKVKLKEGDIFISPLEMQIAYKLYLGSEKDIEDAKHLYVLFKDSINKEELVRLSNAFNIKDKLEFME
ncbi:MAG: hypothetical protein AABY05_02820 [Nanoarchaeota archaeon]